jgi:hypothetical protein
VEHSLTINDTNYALCTSSRCSQVTLSFSEASVFPTHCQANDDTSINEYVTTCRITYRINYDYQQIHIDFDATNDTDNVEEQKSSESLSQTLWYRFKDSGRHTPNEVTRKYECNTDTDCARKFYLRTIDHLVNTGLSQFELIKSKLYNDSLLTGPLSRRRCTDSAREGNITSRKCGHGLCYVRVENYQIDEKPNTKEQKCDYNQNPILFSEIEHHVPRSPEKDKEILEYICNKNVCNRNDLFPKIQNIINEYTNWHVITPDSKTINEKAQSSSIKQTISLYTLVLFIIFIQLFI